MLQELQRNQRNFVYNDSSEEQEEFDNRELFFQQITHSDLSYHDSSSSEQEYYQTDRTIDLSNKIAPQANQKRLCRIKADKFMLKDGYIKAVQRIIQENQQKLSKKTPLLLTDTDKQILQNLQKRKKNYGFFLRTLQIDKNYNAILSNKVQKLKKQNQRKKKVLQKNRAKQVIKQEEDEMKKLVINKKTKQQIVIDKIQKHAYRLGIERIRAQQKQIKHQVKQIDQLNNLKTINLDVKQRNQIYELREQLQKIKQVNKINKLDQKKVLKDLQKNVLHTKNFLISKAQTAHQNKFII